MFKHVIETQQVSSALLVIAENPEPLWNNRFSLTLRLNLFVHIELCFSDTLRDVKIFRDDFPIKGFLRKLHLEQSPKLKDLDMLGCVSHEYDKFLYLSLCGYDVYALWCEGSYVCVSADKRLLVTSVCKAYGTVYNVVNLSGQMRKEMSLWRQCMLKGLEYAKERMSLEELNDAHKGGIECS